MNDKLLPEIKAFIDDAFEIFDNAADGAPDSSTFAKESTHMSARAAALQAKLEKAEPTGGNEQTNPMTREQEAVNDILAWVVDKGLAGKRLTPLESRIKLECIRVLNIRHNEKGESDDV